MFSSLKIPLNQVCSRQSCDNYLPLPYNLPSTFLPKKQNSALSSHNLQIKGPLLTWPVRHVWKLQHEAQKCRFVCKTYVYKKQQQAQTMDSRLPSQVDIPHHKASLSSSGTTLFLLFVSQNHSNVIIKTYFNHKKSFVHPHNLKSRVPPPPPQKGGGNESWSLFKSQLRRSFVTIELKVMLLLQGFEKQNPWM